MYKSTKAIIITWLQEQSFDKENNLSFCSPILITEISNNDKTVTQDSKRIQ